MRPQILITGGAGFIGLNLLEYLLHNTDWRLIVLDNFASSGRRQLENIIQSAPQRIKLQEGDVRDPETATQAVAGCDFVVNLAAQTGVVPSQKNPYKDEDINIKGLLNLLEAARCQKIKHFVQASSAAVLGEQEPPLHEEMVPKPLAPYGVSKLAGEAYCRAYASSFGLKTTVLRFSNVYGPYSGAKGSVVPLFIENILAGKRPVIYGRGEQTRDFVYAQDIAQGIYLSLIKDLPGRFHLFQLGTGQETSINELFGYLKQLAEKKGYSVPEPQYQPARPGGITRSYADITKAKQELGFSPQVSLEKGLEETFNWFLRA